MFFNFAQPFVFPPYWLNKPVRTIDKDKPLPSAASVRTIDKVHDTDLYTSELLGNLYQCPLAIKWEDEANWWQLPFDPIISVSGSNSIVRTDVLRMDNSREERRGTVKEVWSQQDYQVQIAGMFIGSNGDFPENDMRKLRAYCEERKVIEVMCSLLDVFGINRLAIESFDFAHTPGYENQQFAIKAYSDEDFSLLI